MLSEIKVALRGFAKTPGFTVIALATLALAIGANTAVISLVNALLIRPLPYKTPENLVLLWERRFNSDPTIVGNKISLNGRPHTVVGVMPQEFDFPLPLFNVQGSRFASRADIWKPIAFTKDELAARYSRSYGVIGRLRPNVL